MKEIKDSHIEFDESRSGRRGFLKKSAVLTAPIILSAFSRPVLAGDCTLSGLQSGNLSRSETDECAGMGLSPGYWKNHTESWKIILPSEMYHSVFLVNTGSPDHDTKYNKASMLDTMLYFNNNTDGPGNHLVAALLNYHASYLTPFPYSVTLDQISQYHLDYLAALKVGEQAALEKSSFIRKQLDLSWKLNTGEVHSDG